MYRLHVHDAGPICSRKRKRKRNTRFVFVEQIGPKKKHILRERNRHLSFVEFFFTKQAPRARGEIKRKFTKTVFFMYNSLMQCLANDIFLRIHDKLTKLLKYIYFE